jgi:heme-degrading monooxygenase HmoA
MFARVSVYEIPGERMDEAIKGFEAALEEISACEGFHEAFLLVDRADERATTVTLWTTQVAMETSAVTASRLRSEAARSADGSVLSAQQYELATHVTAPQSSVSD